MLRPTVETIRPNGLCRASHVYGLRRELVGLIIALVVTLLIPLAAKGGMVIEERVTSGGGKDTSSPVISRKLMVQGYKEKLDINDRLSVIIDASTGIVTLVYNTQKSFRELPLRKAIGTGLDPNRLLYLPFKSTGKTRQALGFKCEEYASAKVRGPLMTTVTACFSTDAVGSDDFTHFMKSLLQRVGGGGQRVSVPGGVPLMIESIHRTNPSYTLPPDVPAKDAAQFKSRIAKIPPQITHVEVTKISSQNLAPEVFTIPSDYTRSGPVPD
jgi:hypothetical protein